MLTLLLVFLLPVFSASRCNNSAVGDPCTPEANTAFDPSEAFLELSSVQCATRVCLVKGLDGNPHRIYGESMDCPAVPSANPDCDGMNNNDDAECGCVTQEQIDQSVYCSCRCAAPAGSGIPTCGCPGGFHCEEILQSGGPGIIGDYCVKND